MPRTKSQVSPKAEKFFPAVGRRREAVARIRLFAGKGETTVNNLPIAQYFPGEIAQKLYKNPFLLTETFGKYYARIKVEGGGKQGQLGAVVHGIARALNLADREKFRPILKKEGFLTRDPRTRERRKVGRGGKARRKKQSPKR